jgi:hypothetical protein
LNMTLSISVQVAVFPSAAVLQVSKASSSLENTQTLPAPA